MWCGFGCLKISLTVAFWLFVSYQFVPVEVHGVSCCSNLIGSTQSHELRSPWSYAINAFLFVISYLLLFLICYEDNRMMYYKFCVWVHRQLVINKNTEILHIWRSHYIIVASRRSSNFASLLDFFVSYFSLSEGDFTYFFLSASLLTCVSTVIY